jgi:hypothetical protein
MSGFSNFAIKVNLRHYIEGSVVKGEVKISEFASTNDEDEYEFKVTATDGEKGAKDKLR